MNFASSGPAHFLVLHSLGTLEGSLTPYTAGMEPEVFDDSPDFFVDSRVDVSPARNVYVYFYVKRIAAVDTAKQQFEISFYQYIMWAPSPEELARFEANPDTAQPEWVPILILLNMREKLSEAPNNGGKKNLYQILRQGSCEWARPGEHCPHSQAGLVFVTGEPNVWGDSCAMPENEPVLLAVAHEVMVCCSQRFDLQSFPFDVQSIVLHFEADTATNTMRLHPCPIGFGGAEPTVLFLDESGELAEWEVHAPLAEFYTVGNYDQFALVFKVKRLWRVYLWRVGLMVALISSLSLTLYAVDVSDLDNRISNLLTLLLTMVAFQFVISTSIPNLPYLTYMDKYIMASFIFIALICVQSAVFSSVEALSEYDSVFALGAGLTWVLFHLYAWFYVRFVALPREQKKLFASFLELNDVPDTDFTVSTSQVQLSGLQ